MSTPIVALGTWITESDDPRIGVLWSGSEDYSEDLEFVLGVARKQCTDFAPALAEDAPVPDNYVAAQILQARALARAGVTDSGDQAGGYGETVVVYPLDWTVKALLRPRKGRPYLGGRRRADA